MLIMATYPRIPTGLNLIATIAATNQSNLAPGTCYHGNRESLMKKLAYKNASAIDMFVEFANSQPDYDPTRETDKRIREQNQQFLQNQPYEEKLIHKYINDLVISFDNHSKEAMSYSAREKSESEYHKVRDDDGNEELEGNFLQEEVTISRSEIDKLRAELPLQLKSVIEYGHLLGISTISVLKVLQHNDPTFSNRGYYQVSALLAYKDVHGEGIRRMDPKIDYVRPEPVTSSTPGLVAFVKWLNGKTYNQQYEDLCSLLHTITVCNISLDDVDVTQYSCDFIDSLTDVYLSSNYTIFKNNLSAYALDKLKTTSTYANIQESVDSIILELLQKVSLCDFLHRDFNINSVINEKSDTEKCYNYICEYLLNNPEKPASDEELTAIINRFKYFNYITTDMEDIVIGSDDFLHDSSSGDLIQANIPFQSPDVNILKGIIHNSGCVYALNYIKQTARGDTTIYGMSKDTILSFLRTNENVVGVWKEYYI